MKDFIVPPFNVWLKTTRKKLLFTQTEMAEWLGLPFSTYVAYELGNARPTLNERGRRIVEKLVNINRRLI